MVCPPLRQLGVLLVTFSGLPAMADTAAPASSDTTVVVSATRSAQPARDLPVSIDVLGKAELQDTQWRVNLSEALVGVPGVMAQNRQNLAQDLQISVRGFGARASFGVRGVRLYSDGIPASMPDGQGQVSHFDLGSAARLEILRGPFSVLYGNASGGVIAVYSEAGEPGAVLEPSFAVGSFGSQRQGVKFSGDTDSDGRAFNYLLDAVRYTTDGYRQHSSARRDFINARLSYTPSPASRLTLLANTLDMPRARDPLGLTLTQWLADPRQAGSNAVAYNTRKTMQQSQLGLNGEWRVDAGGTANATVWGGQRRATQFQSIARSSQAAPTQPGGVIDLERVYSGTDMRWTQPARFAGGAVTSTIGIALERMDEIRRGYENFSGATLGVQGNLRRDEDNRFASDDVYLQSQWDRGPWLLLAGVRHSRVDIESTDRFVTAGNPDDSGRQRFAATTPALGATWRSGPWLNLYVAYGQGFETPTGNELAYRADGSSGLNLALRAATSRHFEGGVKARVGENGRLNVATFEVRTRDELVVASSSGGRSAFANGGDTRRQGLEGVWRHAFDTGDGRLATTLVVTTMQASFEGGTGAAQALSGKRLPGVPAHSLFASIDWETGRRASHNTPLTAGLEWHAVGRVFTSDANVDAAPGYRVLNAHVGLARHFASWRWKAFVRVDNLTDRAYVGSVIVNESLGRYYEPAPGRHWMSGLDLRFDF